MSKINKILAITIFFLPISVFAVDFNLAGSDFKGIIQYLISLLSILIPILFSLAFLIFFWGLSKFILNSSGNQADIKKGKDYMMWGILALFILMSYEAIIIIIAKEFQIGDGKTVPQLPSEASDSRVIEYNNVINQ